MFCIFDAKHTQKIDREQERVILAYQQDLGCSFGGLISEDEKRKNKEDKESREKTWYTKLEFSKEAKESNREQLEKLLEQITKELMFLD